MRNPKQEEIERLRQEHREAKDSSRRKENVRERQVRFLIVCEGTMTEPYYFKSLVNNHVSTVREEDIKGEGMATIALVDKTSKIRDELERKNAMSFDRVWVVFDKDDFNDFNEAIEKASSLGFHSAWSNEAFELWYYLHFEYLVIGISRSDYIKKLELILKDKTGNKNYRYKKGDTGIYALLQQYGNENLAKRYAKRLRDLYEGTDYAKHKPCTTVDILVEELEHPEELL